MQLVFYFYEFHPPTHEFQSTMNINLKNLIEQNKT